MPKYTAVVVNLGYASYDVEREILADLDFDVIPAVEDCTTADQVITAAAEADAVLVREAPLSHNVIKALNRCRAIVRYGVGVDNIDLDAARRHQIYVANVPGYGTEEVSDHAAALLLACVRTLLVRDTRLRQGRFETDINDDLYRTTGKTLGLVGYGKISQALHRKWKGFLPTEVLVYDPFVDDALIEEQGGTPADMPTLLSKSDYISLHAPLNSETRHIIDAKALRRVKPTAVIVNTARGELIEEKALIAALKEGRVLAAGLDVFEDEPISRDNPLLEMANVILSGHTGWYSKDSVRELQTRAAQEIRRVFLGEPPEYWVNPW